MLPRRYSPRPGQGVAQQIGHPTPHSQPEGQGPRIGEITPISTTGSCIGDGQDFTLRGASDETLPIRASEYNEATGTTYGMIPT
jgi:hypothetical protein